MSNILEQLAPAWHRGTPKGIYSVCSAHPWVLEAAIDQAQEDGSHLLIEATSNQVNHLGGYTGMKPADFMTRVHSIAQKKGFPIDRLILGGDHLGPNPWQKQSADEAMQEAVKMVEAYVHSGFQKIHLDASMACAGDPSPLSDETIAARAAILCAAAEKASGAIKPVYVIGTEVPVPGGATESLSELEVTRKDAVTKTLNVHRDAFEKAGLTAAWPRVIALVVQPGVEFNHDAVVDYVPSRATGLIDVLNNQQGLVYEAHSTDYQQPEAYKNLVRDGFAILKVGPALTFAMRQALDALSEIETELIAPGQRALLPEVVEFVMRDDKRYWGQHYGGNEQTTHLLRRFSYSDRVRYYWNDSRIVSAVDRLLGNLQGIRIPETVLSAFMPEQYHAVRAGKLQPQAHALLIDSIRTVLRPYAAACNA